VSISLDHTQAKDVLFEQADAARRGELTELAADWKDRVMRLGELCPHGKSSTVIAALGTALLAKSTNSSVDVYSLLDRGESPNSYSARSLADNVWARHRAELEIDLGANGANPLNNTPFIGKTRIDEISGVKNRDGWAFFIECVAAAQRLETTDDARQALSGFIVARSRSLLPPLEIHPAHGDNLKERVLISLIEKFVAEDSEGGRRAQAAVAALLDASFSPPQVAVGVINDPDRHAPLDVSVTDELNRYLIAFEVKDKPIEGHHVRQSIEKTVKNHAVRNFGFAAISQRQTVVDFDDVTHWAARHGVKVTVFTDWRSLYLACKCFASTDDQIFEGKVFRNWLVRNSELGVSRDSVIRLQQSVATEKAASDG